MRRLIFSILILLYLASHSSHAQQHRSHPDYMGWARMIPTHIKGQFAGGMGLASAGIGWDYGRTNQWESEVFFGILPAKYADQTHITLSLRQLYIPWDITLSERFSLEPFTCGLYLNFISGDRFWVHQPSKYPGAHYYTFSSRIRLHTCIGQRVRWNLESKSSLKSISLYYELSANDLNIISKMTNRELRLSDIIFFSVGVRFQLQR